MGYKEHYVYNEQTSTDQHDSEEEIIFIKGQYVINRERDNYSEFDNVDAQTEEYMKQRKVNQLREKYGIKNEKSLDTKIFCWVVLPFCLVSFIHFTARFDIAVTYDGGLKESLNLSDAQYNLASAILFIPYFLFEILSNVLLKYVRPHFFISFYILMLGIITICNAYVTSFTGLLVVRFFNGLFQSNSSCLYYILANYYPNFKSQRIFTLYSSLGSLGGIFLFVISFAAQNISNENKWKYVFIIEGVFIIACSFVLFFTIADFPEGARFLSDDETIYLVKKLEVYSGRSGYQINNTFRDFLSVFKEPLLWAGVLVYTSILCCSYGYAYLEPGIISGLSHSIGGSKLFLEAIPFAISLILSNFVAFISDRIQLRFPFIVSGIIASIIGIILIMRHISELLSYIGCCIVVVGLSCIIPMVICWVSMNFAGHLRRNVCTASLTSIASVSGMFSPFIFATDYAPYFQIGLWFNLGALCFALIGVGIYTALIYRNDSIKKSTSYREEFDRLGLREKTLLGDKNPLFRYLY